MFYLLNTTALAIVVHYLVVLHKLQSTKKCSTLEFSQFLWKMDMKNHSYPSFKMVTPSDHPFGDESDGNTSSYFAQRALHIPH